MGDTNENKGVPGLESIVPEPRSHFLDVGKLPRLPTGRWVGAGLGKGGNGKSTSLIQLAKFGSVLGHSVLLIDADYQQRSLSLWRNVRIRNDIAVEACPPAAVEDIVHRARARGFDLILIDTAAALDQHSPTIARLANFALLFTRVGKFDVGVTVKRARWLRAQGCHFGIVINGAPALRMGAQSPLVVAARQELKPLGGLWQGQITYRHSILTAVASGSTVFEMDPSDRATHEYANLWRGLVAVLQKQGGK